MEIYNNFFEAAQQIQKNISALYDFYAQAPQTIAANVEAWRVALESVNSYSRSIGIAEQLSSALASLSFAGTEHAVARSAELIGAFNSLVQKNREPAEIAVSDDVIASLHELSEFVPRDQKEEFENITQISPGVKGKLLTADNIKFILSIVFSLIISLVVKYAPDPATDEILQNQQIQIAQNSVQAELIEVGNTLEAEENQLMQEEIDLLKRLVNLVEDLVDEPNVDDETVIDLSQGGDIPLDEAQDIPNIGDVARQNDDIGHQE